MPLPWQLRQSSTHRIFIPIQQTIAPAPPPSPFAFRPPPPSRVPAGGGWRRSHSARPRRPPSPPRLASPARPPPRTCPTSAGAGAAAVAWPSAVGCVRSPVLVPAAGARVCTPVARAAPLVPPAPAPRAMPRTAFPRAMPPASPAPSAVAALGGRVRGLLAPAPPRVPCRFVGSARQRSVGCGDLRADLGSRVLPYRTRGATWCRL